ncbi:MAG: DUF167 domain-containing protein [Candidatus Micrarchaeota archaeon]|nr:DUF167 domain-containing protein [Candidatus Micrarchaeota archaeon]
MRISVTVTPNAKKALVIAVGDMGYKVKVDAPATGGRANSRLVEVLADHFDVPRSRVRIVNGLSSRRKVVEISG